MLFLYEIVCSAQPIHPSSKSNEELSYSEDNGLLLLLFFVCSLLSWMMILYYLLLMADDEFVRRQCERV
jgi:hypothetical protein